MITHVRSRNSGTVRFAPYDVYLDQRNAFWPDLVFISNENLYKIEEDGLHGAPDLVIEILSPSTAKYHLKKKKAVYERCGIKEYWVVDPATKAVAGYALRENKFAELTTETGLSQSPLLGVAFRF